MKQYIYMLLLFVRGTTRTVYLGHLIGLVEKFSLQVRADFRKSCFFCFGFVRVVYHGGMPVNKTQAATS